MKTIFKDNAYYVLSDNNNRISDALTSQFEAAEFTRWLAETEPKETDTAILMAMFKDERAKRKVNKVSRKKQDVTSPSDGEDASAYGGTTKSIPMTMTTKAAEQPDGGTIRTQSAQIGGMSNA